MNTDGDVEQTARNAPINPEINKETLILPPEKVNESKDSEDAALIADILTRHEKWKETREQVKMELNELQIEKSKLYTTVKLFLMAQLSASCKDEKMRNAISEMIELDNLIKEKNKLAKQLRRTRESSFVEAERDQGTGHAVLPPIKSSEEEQEIEDEYDEDDEEFNDEMKSVHSLETRTFITEPKFVPKAAQKARPDQLPRSLMIPFDRRNFIQRNILLGAEARYFDALTDEEKSRIDNILTGKKTVHNNDEDWDHFVPRNHEFKRLEEIESRLEELTRVVLEKITSSEFAKEFTSLTRDISTVMNDVDALKEPKEFLKEEHKKIQEIDDELTKLQDAPQVQISQEQLQELLAVCLKELEEQQELEQEEENTVAL